MVAETAFEYNRMLAVAHYLSEDEVNATRLHIGLVNGTNAFLFGFSFFLYKLYVLYRMCRRQFKLYKKLRCYDDLQFM